MHLDMSHTNKQKLRSRGGKNSHIAFNEITVEAQFIDVKVRLFQKFQQ